MPELIYLANPRFDWFKSKIDVVRNSPYSSSLNPIEEALNLMKNHVRNARCRKEKELLIEIINACRIVTPEKARNLFYT